MAINVTTLFTRLGKLFRQRYLAVSYQDDVPTAIDDILDEYTGDERLSVSGLPALISANLLGIENIWGASGGIRAAAEATLIRTVFDDNPAQAGTLTAALSEVIRQMRVQSESVKLATVAATAATVSGYTNQGNGAICLSTLRGDGLSQQNIIAEVGKLLCTTDSQTGGATTGVESWQYAGQAGPGDASLYTWPTGSGASTTITGISAFGDNTGGNLLTNSDFETWAGSPLAASNWTLAVGTWGTDIVREASTVYTQTYAAKIVGNASGSGVLVNLQQTFNDGTTGTAGTLLPSTSYALNFYIKADVVPAAGVITIDLVDGSNTVIQDDQGVNNSIVITCSTALSTSYASLVAKVTAGTGISGSNVFRLPKTLPSTIKLRIRVTTAISTSSNIFIDDMALGRLTALYDGGPGCAIFSGSSKWIAGDQYAITQTNNRGGGTGASLQADFQAMFDAAFDMRAKGLLLPTDASPTQANSLIYS